jgi:ribosomal peptide maturation radical SAM protein 1
VRVLLVVMPFAALDEPALGVSTLKALLQRDGVECDVAYLNLVFAGLLSHSEYERIAEGLPFTAFAGEWVFVPALFERDQPDPDEYVSEILKETWRLSDDDVTLLWRARDRAPGFVAQALRAVDWQKYDLIGFTSFGAQNIAALALAKGIKERQPGCVIAFGGANWAAPMGQELLEAFPFVDLACSGEAEYALPRLLPNLSESARLRAIPGLILRSGGRAISTGKPLLVSDLDDLPVPDHEDYYRALSGLGLDRRLLPALPVEMSRGCWWASRRPCTFCGLNGEVQRYRAKSAQRIERELRSAAGDRPCQLIEVVDNVVPPAFFDEVLPALERRPLGVPLFVSVRPTVTRDQVRALAAAGAFIQPGIESLSDHVLTLMNKGTRCLENVRLLKWCKAEGLRAYWNLIYGSPGEQSTDYEDMLDLMHSISFLPPPERCSPLSLERFSRYFHDPDAYGLSEVRPLAPYTHIYPFADSTIRNIAAFFDFDSAAPPACRQHLHALRREVDDWRDGWRGRSFGYRQHETGCVVLSDRRSGGAERTTRLAGLDAALLVVCEDIASEGDVLASLAGDEEADDHARERLRSLTERGLLVSDGERYLTLALPDNMS